METNEVKYIIKREFDYNNGLGPFYLMSVKYPFHKEFDTMWTQDWKLAKRYDLKECVELQFELRNVLKINTLLTEDTDAADEASKTDYVSLCDYFSFY